MRYLRVLMKIVRKIGRITDEELSYGLRETVMFGARPVIAPSDDVYDVPDPTDGAPLPFQGHVDPTSDPF